MCAMGGELVAGVSGGWEGCSGERDSETIASSYINLLLPAGGDSISIHPPSTPASLQ